MSLIFVDTSGWVALKHRGDKDHAQAVALHKSLLGRGDHYLTTNFILDESYTLLLRRVGHHVAVELGEEVRASQLVQIHHLSAGDEETAWADFKRYGDKGFSFTDCTSFGLMQRLGIQQAFTNDHHFEQIGLQILLK